MRCPQCHMPVEDGKQVCDHCGCRIPSKKQAQAADRKPTKGKYTAPKKEKPLLKVLLCIAAVLPVGLLLFLLWHGKPDAVPPQTPETVAQQQELPEAATESSEPPATEPAPTELAKEGYVREDCSELNIRKGPSVTFGKLGHLEALDRVVITEITTDGEREWGHMELGWVCLEYIEWGQPPASGYEVVIEQYRDTAPGTGIDSFGPYVNENVPWVYEYESIRYALLDLNEDGIKECVVAAGQNDGSAVLLDLFTLRDGVPVHVVRNMGYGATLLIFADGSFGISASGDPGHNTIAFYELPPNSTEPRLISGIAIEKGAYYAYGETGERKPVTEAKFAELITAWDQEQLTVKWSIMR